MNASLPITLKATGNIFDIESEKELKILCIRIGELVELNGEEWVKASRQTLLDEWEYIVNQGIIR